MPRIWGQKTKLRKHLLTRKGRRRPISSVLQGLVLVFLTIVNLEAIVAKESIPISNQPAPDAVSYVREAVRLSEGKGFGVDFDEKTFDFTEQSPTYTQGRNPSRYPPGFPIFLSPFAFFAQEGGIQVGAKAISALIVVVVAVLALAISGPLGAIFSQLALLGSPFLLKSAQLVMSDAFGALLTLSAMALVFLNSKYSEPSKIRSWSAVGIGVISGYAILTRLSLAIVLCSAVFCLRRRKDLYRVILGALPMLIFLGLYQWVMIGSPLATGYSLYVNVPEFDLNYALTPLNKGDRAFIFDDRLNGVLMNWTCPCDDFGPMGESSNLVFYPASLAGLFWVYYPPLFGVAGALYILKFRAIEVVRFAGIVVALNLLMMIFYFYQGIRLVAPSGVILTVFGGAALSKFCHFLARLPRDLSHLRITNRKCNPR